MNIIQILFLFGLLMNYVAFNNAANILAIFTIASPSHHIWNSRLVVALANRGHNVTVLSPQAQKNPVPNLTDLVVEELQDSLTNQFIFEEMSETSNFQLIMEGWAYLGSACTHVMNSAAFQQLMNYPPETKFDLVIIESIGSECILGVVPKFGNPPIIVINAFAVPPWMFEFLSSPNMPSYMPFYIGKVTDHMTFLERMENFLITAYVLYHYHHTYLPVVDKHAAAVFGPQVPAAYEILKNVSIGMANIHPTFDYPWARTQNLIPVAGIHVQDPKPLPPRLQAFLDGAKEGAVLFSLGSNVRSDRLTADKRRAILGALGQLPQRVLWKFESDIQDLPPNVMVGKWLPQNDILAHPNLKLFITHSGLLSTHETIYRGVPVVGIPFVADQHTNIKRLVDHGCGLVLQYKDLTQETLLQAAQEVLKNSSYKENMEALSRRFRDDPQTPLQRAVHWTEFVLRHRGAAHLQSAARELSFAQFFLLDVMAVLLAFPLSIAIAVAYFCCRRKPSADRKLKRN